MALFCDICAGDIEGGSRCGDCSSDVDDQLRRMGVAPPTVTNEGSVVDKRLAVLLADERLLTMVEDLVVIALRSREIESVDRVVVTQAVKDVARAAGVAQTRDALLELAAVALAFAKRLPKREGRRSNGTYAAA